MPHASPITCIDHHAGSGLLVTGGYDGRVIASRDGAELWAVRFDDLVNDVRVDDAGTSVAVAVADTFAYVVDAVTGWTDAALGPHGDDVNAVRWIPGSNDLACSMDHHDPTVRVWSRADDGWSERTMARHDSGVFGVAIAPDASRMATAAEDGTARIWDLATGDELHVLAHPGDPETIDWSPSGDAIATGCDDGVLRIWDPVDGSIAHELTDAGAAVRFVRFTADGRHLLVGAYDATLRRYRTADWKVDHQYRAPFQWERAACATDDGVAVASFGGTPVHHPADSTAAHQHRAAGAPADPAAAGRPSVTPTFGINALTTVAAGDGGDASIIIGRDDGSVVEIRTNRVIARHDSIVNTVAVSPDGRSVASADYRGRLVITDLAGAGDEPGRVDAGAPLNSVLWSAAGDAVFGAGYDGRIRCWNAAAEPLAAWAAHHAPIKSIAWSDAHGGLVVAGSSDGTLSAWTVDGDEVWRAAGDEMVLVNAVAVATEAGDVISVSRDQSVRRWDIHTGALLERLPLVHAKSAKAIAASADGRRLLSGSYDGRAVVWHRGDDDRWSWRVLRHHGKPGVPAVRIAGDALLTAGWDGSVASWTLSGELVEVWQPDTTGVMTPARYP